MITTNKDRPHHHHIKPNMRDAFAFEKSYNNELKQIRTGGNVERPHIPVVSSKTLIYNQSRVVSPLNYYGTTLKQRMNMPFIFKAAGIDGINSTKATGEASTKPIKQQYPNYL